MNHRIVARIIAAVEVVFVAAAVLFAWRAGPPRGARPASAPAAIPHALTGIHARCADCHPAQGGSTPVPPTHRSFADPTCTLCHSFARRQAGSGPRDTRVHGAHSNRQTASRPSRGTAFILMVPQGDGWGPDFKKWRSINL